MLAKYFLDFFSELNISKLHSINFTGLYSKLI